MKEIKISLMGFGNVGQALARLLISKQSFLARQHQLNIVLTGILTAHHGTVINEDGIDMQAALSLAEANQSLQTLSGDTTSVSGVDFVRVCHADIVFENTPVNYDTGEPALSHIKKALKMGKCAITANKGPIVHGYRELKDLALAHGGRFMFESTVMDGAPIFSMWREALPGAELQSFRGVLNSTTNLILTLMEDGLTFDEAVSHAQSIGIAESDPSGDIEGWDAAVKVAALVTVLMDIPTTPQDIEREGIGELKVVDVIAAKQDGHRWKLICNAGRDGEKAHASVRLERVDNSDPFYSVMGTSSAVSFSSDVLGDLTIIEENPGPHTTAYGLFADMLNALEATALASV